MNIIKTPNYNKKIWSNRDNKTFPSQKWDIIVNHITEGLMPGVLTYMDRLDTEVSAHFLITKKGEVYSQVGLEHGAWHCIKSNPLNPIVKARTAPANLYTVGIEHEGVHAQTQGRMTDAQYKASLEVHKYIIEQYEALYKEPFKIDRDHIIGHYEVSDNRSKSDPGVEFPWAKLMADLKAWDVARKTPTTQAVMDRKNGPWQDETSRLWFRAVGGSFLTRAEAEAEIKKMENAGIKGAWIQAVVLDK